MCCPQANEVLCKTIPEACEFGSAVFYGKNVHILITKLNKNKVELGNNLELDNKKQKQI
jgi:hypothetical protein